MFSMYQRPAAVTVLAIFQFMGGALWLLIVVFGLVGAISAPQAYLDTSSILVWEALLGLSVFQIVSGIGLWRLRGYGRTMQIVTACIGLAGVPFGTIVSLVILVYLFKPGVKVLFSGRAPEELSAQETADLTRALAGGGVATAVLVIGVVVLATLGIGIVAAIAVPGLLRARVAGNEAAAIGALRALSAAETSYAGANGGYYDSETCLAVPSACLPHYSGSAFLGQRYGTRNGYQLAFTPGPPPLDDAQSVSPSSMTSFVVFARPITPSRGSRIFCLDQTGVIRTISARDPRAVSARTCPAAWPPIE
jgi:hypothetical protein